MSKPNLREPAEIRAEKKKPKLMLFLDKECKIPLDTVGFDDIVEVGTTATKKVYLKNISEQIIDQIQVEIDDPEANVKLSTDSLTAGEVAELTVYWNPSPDRLSGLNAPIKVKGRVIYS